METSVTLRGHCSQCHKVWTLETRQGVCQWCNRPASCQTIRTKPRPVKSHRSRSQTQAPVPSNGCDQLEGKWAFYYKVAYQHSKRVEYQDREDTTHDIIIELAKAEERDNKPLPELRAHKIASLMVALYWRKRHLLDRRVCLFNGRSTEPNCDQCQHKAGEPCGWLGVEKVISLNTETQDADGYTVELIDLIADDSQPDLAEWLDLQTVLLGLPLRAVEVAYKRDKGKALSVADRKYLWKLRKRQQKALI